VKEKKRRRNGGKHENGEAPKAENLREGGGETFSSRQDCFRRRQNPLGKEKHWAEWRRAKTRQKMGNKIGWKSGKCKKDFDLKNNNFKTFNRRKLKCTME
jgi:hypothetical protein